MTTGEREIEPTEAPIVEPIFRDFIAGVSPKQIAKNLNREGIAGPFGGAWSPSTIYGNGKRGSGILNNELYKVWTLRRRIHHGGQAPPRMLRRTRPGTLRQPSDHPPRRGGSARAQGAAGESS